MANALRTIRVETHSPCEQRNNQMDKITVTPPVFETDYIVCIKCEHRKHKLTYEQGSFVCNGCKNSPEGEE